MLGVAVEDVRRALEALRGGTVREQLEVMIYERALRGEAAERIALDLEREGVPTLRRIGPRNAGLVIYRTKSCRDSLRGRLGIPRGDDSPAARRRYRAESGLLDCIALEALGE